MAELQKSELVVKDNALINASYNLELVEQRIILLAILEIRRIGNAEFWMPFDTQIEVYAEDYAKVFGTTRQASYIALKEACKTLFNRQFSYQEISENGKKYNVTARWVNRIFYSDDMASIKLDFTHYVIPLVTELEKKFTSYELNQVSNITSGYGLRLYELVIAWKNAGKTPMFELSDFRQKLGVGSNSYQRMGQFKEKVLDFAVSQINEHTDIVLSYEQHKQGRKIIGFTFVIKLKTKPKKPKENTERDPNTKDIFDGLTDQEREIVAQKQEYARQKGITNPAHIENLVNQGLERHRQAVQADKERKERKKAERQAQRAKEQAEKQAKDEQERQERERAEQRKKSFIEMFESLDEQYQEQALDEVAKSFQNNIFSNWFKEAREQGTAHKDPRFLSKFYELFGV